MSEGAFILGPGGQVARLEGRRGATPPCPEARFKRGEVVKRRKVKPLIMFPDEFIIAVAIPPGFSPDYALADLVGKPRPFMVRLGDRSITYLCVREDDNGSYLIKERYLLPTGKPSVEIGIISESPAPALERTETP